MLITVDDKWTYECEFAVRIGDKVELPSANRSGTWIGTVTALESTGYNGPVKCVVSVVEKIKNQSKKFRSIDDSWEVSNTDY